MSFQIKHCCVSDKFASVSNPDSSGTNQQPTVHTRGVLLCTAGTVRGVGIFRIVPKLCTKKCKHFFQRASFHVLDVLKGKASSHENGIVGSSLWRKKSSEGRRERKRSCWQGFFRICREISYTHGTPRRQPAWFFLLRPISHHLYAFEESGCPGDVGGDKDWPPDAPLLWVWVRASKR